MAAAKDRGLHTVWVDETECIGCNLCSSVCPVAGCITMKDVTNGAPFESWNDRIAKGTAHVPGGAPRSAGCHGDGGAIEGVKGVRADRRLTVEQARHE
jgi:Fe-S-cluster-containing hydrogenase component 2